MSTYALGIDCGNTAIKAALFNEFGEEVFAVACNYPTHIPRPNYTEGDLSECWKLCSGIVRQVVTKSGIAANKIMALGCSGHGNGVYLLDDERSPLLAIKSLDSRAEDEVNQLKVSEGYTMLTRRNRQGAWSSQTAVLLHWLKRHQPDIYQRIGQVLFCKDYINFRLTGECATEWGDLTASGLFDFENDSVSDELLSAYDIVDIRSKLPPVYNSAQVIGSITAEAALDTGLIMGTPVIAGMFDVVACAYGSRAYQNGDTSVVAGTWNINQVVTRSLPSEQVFMACKMNESQYLAIESSTCSASNLEWLVQRFFYQEKQQAEQLGLSIFDQFNQKLASLQLNEGLPLFMPYLYGTTDKQSAAANIVGLKAWHEDIHVVYSFYEGIVFAHFEHIERLRASGYHIDTISISGGASRSDYWCQLFADILNVQVSASNVREVGACGVAMMAFETVTGCVEEQKTTLQHRFFRPDILRHHFFAGRYKKYKRIRDALVAA
ncbi:FGGY-family carbohydrate kinase [Vibrio sp. Hal054]|uniref:FGGY-family carbohydrate kinase n=1 Tax=Vibrio sp. Hal054 TaxID=3035158 RepID=UPI00301D5FC2